MQLKDFVSETLKEILDGVVAAQSYYEEKDASVNCKTQNFEGLEGMLMWDRATGRLAQTVEFDVALTTTEGKEAKGGIGVFAGSVGLGAQRTSDASNTSYSRIKFSIPIFLPARK